MKIIFFDKKKETYEIINNAYHMHIDYIGNKNKKCYVIYTEEEIKYFFCNDYNLHKIECSKF